MLRNPRGGRRPAVLGTALVLLALAQAAPAVGQVLSEDMLYTSVQPCRIFDTRLQAAGALAANTSRAFHVVGSSNDFVAQGGKSGGCSIPGFSNGAPQALAVMINLIAVGPAGPGNLRAYPTDSAQVPLASVINYSNVPGLNIANGLTVPLRQDVEGGDIKIQADVSGTHVVADVVGYFSPATPRRYYLTTTSHDGLTAPSACSNGFHMASLSEIFETSQLQYDATLGWTLGDRGEGVVGFFGGWIRTGYPARATNVAGVGNCNAYTSNSAGHYGTVVLWSNNWAAAATATSPWQASIQTCSTTTYVWCVEDR